MSFHSYGYIYHGIVLSFNAQDVVGTSIADGTSLASNITLENTKVCMLSWENAFQMHNIILCTHLHHNDVMNQVSDALHVNDGNLAHYRGVN